MRSLSFTVSVWTALAISVSMGIYAVLEHVYMPGMNLPELLTHHSLHVLALGLSIYVVCMWMLQRLVVRPMQAVRLHLLRVGIGKLEHLEMDTNVFEVRSIVRGVNDMVDRVVLAELVSAEQQRSRVERTKQLVMQAEQKTEEIERISRQLDARNHPLGRSIEARLYELHKTLVWIFLKV